ncbi:Serine/threonine protein kinase [Cystobacter fuscus DSM 2262]|uniref:Serine/threonine protein kinase n=1 Tax=Cystobacter fuscus (strain ATCC 25194 / DSM 2262 / NBRC 100088 / M29) TaxID=1242864 RepID=S9PC89_CYSF2|nr:protein kinase [Cystobacter fuscus]EPX59902.1 Serine/threonine protein kinase [Cystobacter fuscus DSM 2262]
MTHKRDDAYPWPDAAEPSAQSLYGEELSPGALVGGSVVEGVRYRGGAATLYRARAARTGEPVALKVLHLQFATARGALRRFQQEGETLRRLRHPHIVDVMEHGTLPDGRPFIAMEWLEGRDLAAELAARGPLSTREALEVLEQVGSALRAAHGAGVVHRDLKAQNVVVVGAGAAGPQVKLVDFGVAKLLAPEDAGTGATSTGLVLGTPLSMAPEQIRGETPDARTDLYGLGVLLYQLVTGQPPFLGPTQVELEEQHLHAPVPRASERAPVPVGLDAVVARCMEKQREARYPGVDAVLEDLRRVVRGEGAGRIRQVRALGLYVEARPWGRVDDTTLDTMDARMEGVRARMDAQGLTVMVEGSGFLLGVAALPEEPEAEREFRRRVLEMALTLAEEPGARREEARVSLEPTLHVDLATLRSDGLGGTGLGGGRLMRLSAWTGEHPGRGVLVTKEALTGLEAGLHSRPLSSGAQLSHVWREAH